MTLSLRPVRRLGRALTVLATLALAAHAAADNLVTYNFDNSTPSPTGGSSNALATDVSSLYNALNYVTGNPGKAVSVTNFYSSPNAFNFTLSPKPGYGLTLSSLSFDNQASSTGPHNFSLQYALGTSTTYTTLASHATSTSITNGFNTFDISAIGSGTTVNSAVNFRLLGTDATGTGGTWRIDNLAVNGATPTVGGTPTTGRLRVATYNVAAAYDATARAGLDIILQGIGNETVNGASRPLDILSLQEASTTTNAAGASITAADVANRLNVIYGANTYAAVAGTGSSSGSGTQALVINTHSTAVVETVVVGTLSSSGMARDELRYKIRPAGTNGEADFYVYAGHWKASQGTDSGATTSNEARRNAEAQIIRTDAANLGADARIIYTGDFNIYTSAETGWATMTAAGNGQAFDPAGQVGPWHANGAYVGIDSQAPAVNAPSGLTGGGLNDRFDFQLVTANLLSGTGPLTYVPNSYHTFGNNGSVALNAAINNPSNTALADLSNRLDILNALTTTSDHLPVVADYSYTYVAAPLPPALWPAGIGLVAVVASRMMRGGQKRATPAGK